MKISSQEEYGLRILIRIAACKDKDGMSIPMLSEKEGLSAHYIAKLTRMLRMGGLVNSTPGNKGGYILAKPATDIPISQVLKTLGGNMFDTQFCGTHAGNLKLCTNSVDCSARSLWQMVQFILDGFLDKISLHDLVNTEQGSTTYFERLLAPHRVMMEAGLLER